MNMLKLNQEVAKEKTREFYTLCHFEPKYGIFPGSLPVSLSRNDLKFVKERYSVCDKTDGVRYMMYMDKKSIYLVDRLMNFYYLCENTTQDSNCVYDGELVDDISGNGKQYYMIFDVFASNGRTVKDIQNHKVRIGTILNYYPVTISKDITINVKRFHYANKFSQCLNQKLPYKTDGYIFTPMFKKIFNGTDRRTYKWKECSEHTIDFEIQTDGHLYLYDKNNNKMKVCEMMYESDDVYNIPSIVECRIVKNDEGTCWKFVKERSDKDRPNSTMTYFSTIKVIEENISLDDLNNLK